MSKILDRFFTLAGDDSPELRRGQLTGLRTVLFLSILVERAHPSMSAVEPLVEVRVQNLILAICLLLTFARPLERLATAVGALTMVHVLWTGFPAQPNHYMLPTAVFLILATVDLDRDPSRHLALQATRWFGAILLFHTGFQKILYGTYFQGQFLAWKIAIDEAFASVFGPLIGGEEVNRLQALGGGGFGYGGYRMRGLLILALSNVVWIFELFAPVALIWRRSRAWALPLTILFLIAIETAAREYFFGVNFVAILLTFSRRDWLSPLAALCALGAGILFLVQRFGA